MDSRNSEVPATELREHGSDIVNRVAFGGEEVVLTRRGKPVAALVSLAALAALHRLEDAEDVPAIAIARKEVEQHGVVSHAEVKARLGL
ncbi:MAG TPA: type II toxin-antitoxin system prevent-host-death family antitoxin [Candidatus Baltobacteraceae bacterium]|nr:type II toxin-antitoxin system prevent-host-death family antitoxin [Candidatus Baltobacteraceae bacterium]